MNGSRHEPGAVPADDRLRILFVSGCWYPHQGQPFQGIFIRRHAEAVALDHQVAVLHPLDQSLGPKAPAIHRSNWGPIQQFQVCFKRSASRAQSQAGFFRAGRTGARRILEEFGRPDVVHFHVVPSAGLTMAVLSVFSGLPVVVTEHWSGYLPESGVRLSWLRRFYTGLLMRRAKVVTTVSDYHRRALSRLGFRGDFKVVPNVVDTSLFRPAHTRKPGPFRLVHVSGLRPEKRVPLIVEAVADATRRGLDLELHVVGEGPEKARCQAIAEGHGLLEQGIFFHGRLDEEGVAHRMRASDAFVLFSQFENSPCVIGESFASGIPVVSSRVGGIPEYISSDRGVLVPPDDGEALVGAMIELVRGGHTWNSRAIREYAENTFSRQTVSGLLNHVYATALDNDLAEAGA